jgi:hypothetical protein
VNDARNYNWIVALKQTFAPYLSAMRSANPTLKVFAYMNGVYAQSNQGPGTGSYPNAWYARDVAGNFISSRSFGNWLMDPTNSAWVTDRAQACGQAIAASGYDGCYLDVLGTSSVDPNYVSSVPWNSRTGQNWTAADWVANTSFLAAQVKSGNPGRLVTGNGLANGNEYFDPASGPTSTLIGPLDGANAQGFVRNESAGINTYRGLNRWKQDVDMLVDAGSRSRAVMGMTKVGVPATSAQVLSWQRYALASFLLGTDGHQYFYFDPDGVNAAVAYDHPDLHVFVGSPSGAYSVTSSGAYVRSFTSGLGVVNPTASTVTVVLGGTYRDLDGVSRTSVTLAPNTGMVFIR